MNREDRYFVLKKFDLSEASLALINGAVNEGSLRSRKAVVVEADWPEYESVWQMLEKRIRDDEWREAQRQAFDVFGRELGLDMAYTHGMYLIPKTSTAWKLWFDNAKTVLATTHQEPQGADGWVSGGGKS